MSPRAHPLMRQLRAAREDRGLSQEALAARIGYGRYTIQQWENGRRSPRLEGLSDYAEALGLELNLTPTGGG